MVFCSVELGVFKTEAACGKFGNNVLTSREAGSPADNTGRALEDEGFDGFVFNHRTAAPGLGLLTQHS